ncbi:MAG: acyl carrier protein [Bacteroidetes bacterium]|nr:acyl carrier protein [Bacteroidota bacterium]MBL6943410.1 acyl carrier protein [Bacteroidales bacterium]
MLEKEIIDKINKVLKSALKLNNNTLGDYLIKDKFIEWDSLKHITIIADLESEFDVLFEPEEIVEMNSSEKIVEIIRKKL